MIKMKDFASGILAASIFFFCVDVYRNNRTEKLNEQYIEIQPNYEAYENITVDDNNCLFEFQSNGTKESVCINLKVNEWLLSEQKIGLRRCKKYEKGLKSQIYNEHNWGNIYSLFLRNNYLKSVHFGYQFLNGSKFGISSELNPNNDFVKIHKTCYFDSYLTNIIPGKTLLKLVDGKVISNTEKFMPYGQDRILLSCDDDILRNIYRANEPGVSVLLMLPNNRILFWRQNNFVLSSANKIAPSGSGSVDWNDCKSFLSAPDGFRKAIIHAMERELWEEAYSSEGKISLEDFMNNTETNIIGHFRWLQKSGKYEFVGVTKFLQKLPGCNAPKPCNMEIIDGDLSPQILTVGEALQTLFISNNMSINKEKSTVSNRLPSFRGIIEKTSELPIISNDGEVKVTKETINIKEIEVKNINDAVKLFEHRTMNSIIEINDYSIPCVMAILYLRQICEDYCEKCSNKSCCKEDNIPCNVKLEEAIFNKRNF
ncbi:MAG: hypothetical protein IJT20_03125 [Synergistaceae bacterium]|nr:hypothetical protein [Synergistaceae bacterium]